MMKCIIGAIDAHDSKEQESKSMIDMIPERTDDDRV
jgi:hypothetical protein